MIDVIVVGGGISGLVTAYELKKRGIQTKLFERSSRIGGSIETLSREGFQLELGANSFLLRPQARALLEELKLTPLSVSSENNSRFLGKRSNDAECLIKAPLSIAAFLSSPLLSRTGKLRLLREPLIGKGLADDETVERFIERRLGPEFLTNLLAPVMSGIYAADLTKLSARTTLERFFNWERESGSILKGALRKMFSRSAEHRRGIMTQFAGGLSELPLALAAKLGEDLILDEEVLEIRKETDRVALFIGGETVYCRKIVISTEARTTSKLLANLSPALAKSLDTLPYSPLGIIYLALRKGAFSDKFRGIGFLRAPQIGDPLLGALFSSITWPHVAPSGEILLTAFVGGMVNPDLSDATNSAIQQRAINSLKTLLQIPEDIRVIYSQYWPEAIPHFPLNHFLIEEQVKKLQESGIYCAVNWIKQPGVADSIERAQLLSKSVISLA